MYGSAILFIFYAWIIIRIFENFVRLHKNMPRKVSRGLRRHLSFPLLKYFYTVYLLPPPPHNQKYHLSTHDRAQRQKKNSLPDGALLKLWAGAELVLVLPAVALLVAHDVVLLEALWLGGSGPVAPQAHTLLLHRGALATEAVALTQQRHL